MRKPESKLLEDEPQRCHARSFKWLRRLTRCARPCRPLPRARVRSLSPDGIAIGHDDFGA